MSCERLVVIFSLLTYCRISRTIPTDRRFLLSLPLTSTNGSQPVGFCGTQCHLNCPDGYVRSPMGCHLCACETATTAHTTPGNDVMTQQTSGYNDPCLQSQPTCALDCGGEYLKGPEGCQYCLCMDLVPDSLRQTTAHGSGNTRPSPDPNKDPPAEICLLAHTICNSKCPYGSIIHPFDCLYCACAGGSTSN